MKVKQCLHGRKHVTKHGDDDEVEGVGQDEAGYEMSVDSKPQKPETMNQLYIPPHLLVGTVDKVESGSVEAVVEFSVIWTGGESGLLYHCDIDKEWEAEEDGEGHDASQQPRGEGFVTRVPQPVLALQVPVPLFKFEVEALFNHPVVKVFAFFKYHRREETFDSLASVDSADGDVVEDDCEENGGDKEEEREEEAGQEVHQNKGRDIFLQSLGVVVGESHCPQYYNQREGQRKGGREGGREREWERERECDIITLLMKGFIHNI